MLLTLLLGAGSSLCWGTADFFGGLQSRRLPALVVAFWSQLAGGLALLLVLLLRGEPPVLPSIVWGLGGGLVGALALVLFYRGLAVGIMSLVAPIAGCGAVVPVLLSIAMGQTPSALAGAGIVVALAGVALVSLHSEASTHSGHDARLSLLLALGAALGFGMFFVFVHRGSAFPGASPLWVVGGARLSSLPLLGLLIALGPRSMPWPGRRMGLVATVGVLDTSANALFAFASTHGNPGVVAVLGSLYPVATVLLGRIVLAERLNRMQHAGVALALAGVVLLSAG
jgi:drug/metabolite transporter (DMT)-like permease